MKRILTFIFILPVGVIYNLLALWVCSKELSKGSWWSDLEHDYRYKWRQSNETTHNHRTIK
jgi:hypothetical protein